MAEQRVIIENENGERYGVTVADQRKLYPAPGWKIVGYEDGSPYEPPEKPKPAASPARKD